MLFFEVFIVFLGFILIYKKLFFKTLKNPKKNKKPTGLRFKKPGISPSLLKMLIKKQSDCNEYAKCVIQIHKKVIFIEHFLTLEVKQTAYS